MCYLKWFSAVQHVKLPLVPHKVDVPIQKQNEEYFGALIGNVLGGNKSEIAITIYVVTNYTLLMYIDTASKCSNSEWNDFVIHNHDLLESAGLNQMPYLSELVVSPGRLQPTFSAQITKYKLIIPHEIPMVSISAIPAHCSCVAKFTTDGIIDSRQAC